MKIKKVTDPEFSRYGRVIDGYDFSKLIKAMEHTPLPEDVIYERTGISQKFRSECRSDRYHSASGGRAGYRTGFYI